MQPRLKNTVSLLQFFTNVLSTAIKNFFKNFLMNTVNANSAVNEANASNVAMVRKWPNSMQQFNALKSDRVRMKMWPVQ